MQIFTFLMDFEGGTYVSQHAAVDLKLAVQEENEKRRHNKKNAPDRKAVR